MHKKDFNKIEVKKNIFINVFSYEKGFGYENKLVFPVYVFNPKCGDFMDLLFLNDDDKLHVYIKDFDRFMFRKTKTKNKKWFCRSCLECFSRESVLLKHKENCLSINGKQSVKLEE